MSPTPTGANVGNAARVDAEPLCQIALRDVMQCADLQDLLQRQLGTAMSFAPRAGSVRDGVAHVLTTRCPPQIVSAVVARISVTMSYVHSAWIGTMEGLAYEAMNKDGDLNAVSVEANAGVSTAL